MTSSTVIDEELDEDIFRIAGTGATHPTRAAASSAGCSCGCRGSR